MGLSQKKKKKKKKKEEKKKEKKKKKEEEEDGNGTEVFDFPHDFLTSRVSVQMKVK